MKILVINAGSSSLKYQLINMETELTIGKGVVERIGSKGSNLKQINLETGKQIEINRNAKNHNDAFTMLIEAMTDKNAGIIDDLSEIYGIGHRIVHSGGDFDSSVYVTEDVLDKCKKNISFAELHMPAHISCIESCLSLMPDKPNVLVFDTVFHATMPDYAYMYAIKYEDYEKYKIRKYGFHGTSHKFVTNEALKYLGNPQKSKIITCHLGNGSSIAAVKDGKCIDTSMGFTPLEGLVMGTRSGDIDPSVVAFLSEQNDWSAARGVEYLNKECGFYGLTGHSDLRDVASLYNAGDKKAILAANIFAYRIKKYIASYYVALGGLDAIVLTGGIGENSCFAKKLIFDGLECLGIKIDNCKNVKRYNSDIYEIQLDDSKVKILVIKTNEELLIARDTKAIVSDLNK
ncbi:MAG TPA: acetate kinase [Clostridiales bacterium]|nr:acetate kinase [Clostridiales bacterium]